MRALVTTAVLLLLVPATSRAEPRAFEIGWLMVMDWDSDYPEAP